MHRFVFSLSISIAFIYLFTYSSCSKPGLPDSQAGNWVQRASLPHYGRGFASSFVIGDRVYVGGGFNRDVGPTGLRDWWSFSLDSGWRQEADFPGISRSGAASFGLDGYGYVGTGTHEGIVPLKDFYRYDPVRGEWDSMPEYPGEARFRAVGFAVQGKGFIGTGQAQGGYYLNDFWQFDPSTRSWQLTRGTIDNFSKRTGAVAVVYQDKAYIVTGMGSGNAMARDFWQFDPAQEEAWTRLGDIANSTLSTEDDNYAGIQRMNAAGWVNDGKLFITLGENGTNISTTWMYDFGLKRWKQRTSFELAGRSGPVAFALGGRNFVGTGLTVSTQQGFDDLDEFLPDQVYNIND